jgi:hypothetical protein
LIILVLAHWNNSAQIRHVAIGIKSILYFVSKFSNFEYQVYRMILLVMKCLSNILFNGTILVNIFHWYRRGKLLIGGVHTETTNLPQVTDKLCQVTDKLCNVTDKVVSHVTDKFVSHITDKFVYQVTDKVVSHIYQVLWHAIVNFGIWPKNFPMMHVWIALYVTHH